MRRHHIICCGQKSGGLDEDEYITPHRAETDLVHAWKETEEKEVPDPEGLEGMEEFIVHDSLLQCRFPCFCVSSEFHDRGYVPKLVLLSVNTKHQ